MTNKQRRRLISIYCKKYINFRLCKSCGRRGEIHLFQHIEMLTLSWDREIFYAVMMAGGKRCL